MFTRRQFLKNCATQVTTISLAGLVSACGEGDGGDNHAPGTGSNTGGGVPPTTPTSTWRMPDEGDAHLATWMSFYASANIWGNRMVTPVQDALARIANAIVAFEPVNMLVSQDNINIARQKLDPRVNLIVAPANDLWIRDTGCVFVKNAQGQRAGVNFNFNGWGNRQTHDYDAIVAERLCQISQVTMLRSKLCLEGGGIEVDGQGTAIITESCVLNPNRNPGWTKAACEAELKAMLGITKVIWLPGIMNKDITDAHTDFYARFVAPGVVVANLEQDPSSYDYAVTRKHLEILQSARDVNNQALKVITLSPPSQIRPQFSSSTFAAGYINFYLVNGGVILPEFGDYAADEKARLTLAALYPQRKVVQVNIDPIAWGGGGIHCSTQQEIR